MANIDAPNGFTPRYTGDGKVYRGTGRRYYKSATAGIIAIGDPVVRVTNSSDPEGGGEIVRHTTGSVVTGVVVGIEPNRDNLDQAGVLLSADTGYVYVEDDPNIIFEVQEVSGGTALAVTNIGEHIDSVAAIDADTSLGRSKYEIDNAALATGNTWVIVGLVRKPDNAVGEHAKWLVKANLHTEVNAGASNISEI